MQAYIHSKCGWDTCMRSPSFALFLSSLILSALSLLFSFAGIIIRLYYHDHTAKCRTFLSSETDREFSLLCCISRMSHASSLWRVFGTSQGDGTDVSNGKLALKSQRQVTLCAFTSDIEPFVLVALQRCHSSFKPSIQYAKVLDIHLYTCTFSPIFINDREKKTHTSK